MRDPQCAGREVSKAVNTSEEYPSPEDSWCIKSSTVNIAALLVGLVSNLIEMHTSCVLLFCQFSYFKFPIFYITT